MSQHVKTLGPQKDWALICLNLHDANSLANRVILRPTNSGWARMKGSVPYWECFLACRTILSSSFLREKAGVDPLASREYDGIL